MKRLRSIVGMIKFSSLCLISALVLITFISFLYFNKIKPTTFDQVTYQLSKLKVKVTEDKQEVVPKFASDQNKGENFVGDSRNSAPKHALKQNNGKNATKSKRVVLRIDQSILSMVKEIERMDPTYRQPIIFEGLGNYTCGRKNHQNKVEDLLCMSPPKFLPKYKNPCWDVGNNRLRCLPYFHVLGMDKCGSTDLFDKIAKHPDVLKNKGVLQKETMWWSWRRYGHWLKRPVPMENFDRYLKYFEAAAATIKSKPNAGLITGDGTPMDMWDMSGWDSIPQNAGLKEPKYITPHLMKHVNPNAKFLIILRNPVERLFSDYFFLKIGKLTTRAFHDHVVKSVKMLHECTRKSTLRTCLYSRKLHLQLVARIHLGFYSVFLRDWFRVFPREQFLILRTEDYSANTSQIIRNVFSFLGLRKLSQSDMVKITSAGRKYVTTAKKKAGNMMDETRAILERLYENYNEELAFILKDERFSWT